MKATHARHQHGPVARLQPPTRRAAQQGMSLVITLVLMLAILLLGVAAISVNSMQERMLGNSKDQEIAYQAAEAGLRDAERFLIQTGVALTPSFDCSSKLCFTPSRKSTPSTAPIYASENAGWGAALSYGAATGAASFPNVAAQPKYLIEQFATIPASVMVGESALIGGGANASAAATVYRISVLAVGLRPDTQVILQSMITIKN